MRRMGQFLCCTDTNHSQTAEPVASEPAPSASEYQQRSAVAAKADEAAWRKSNVEMMPAAEPPVPVQQDESPPVREPVPPPSTVRPEQDAPPPVVAKKETPKPIEENPRPEDARQCKSFKVILEKAEDEPLGLDLDCIDGISAVVSRVGLGVVQRWNEQNPGNAIETLDRIVSVNGFGGDVKPVAEFLHQSSFPRLTLEVRRARCFSIVVNKGGGSIGLALNFTPSFGGLGLLIAEVKDGPVLDWNTKSPNAKVKVNDRIVEVNGISSSPQQLLEELRVSEALTMSILPF